MRPGAALHPITRLNDLPFDLLLGQLDGPPSQRVDGDLALLVLRRVFEIDMLGRFDLQSHLRAARTADQAHDLIQLHFDDGHDLAVALAVDADDLVADFEASVLFGGAAGNDLLDDGVAVFLTQGRADALRAAAPSRCGTRPVSAATCSWSADRGSA